MIKATYKENGLITGFYDTELEDVPNGTKWVKVEEKERQEILERGFNKFIEETREFIEYDFNDSTEVERIELYNIRASLDDKNKRSIRFDDYLFEVDDNLVRIISLILLTNKLPEGFFMSTTSGEKLKMSIEDLLDVSKKIVDDRFNNYTEYKAVKEKILKTSSINVMKKASLKFKEN